MSESATPGCDHSWGTTARRASHQRTRPNPRAATAPAARPDPTARRRARCRQAQRAVPPLGVGAIGNGPVWHGPARNRRRSRSRPSFPRLCGYRGTRGAGLGQWPSDMNMRKRPSRPATTGRRRLRVSSPWASSSLSPWPAARGHPPPTWSCRPRGRWAARSGPPGPQYTLDQVIPDALQKVVVAVLTARNTSRVAAHFGNLAVTSLLSDTAGQLLQPRPEQYGDRSPSASRVGSSRPCRRASPSRAVSSSPCPPGPFPPSSSCSCTPPCAGASPSARRHPAPDRHRDRHGNGDRDGHGNGDRNWHRHGNGNRNWHGHRHRHRDGDRHGNRDRSRRSTTPTRHPRRRRRSRR